MPLGWIHTNTYAHQLSKHKEISMPDLKTQKPEDPYAHCRQKQSLETSHTIILILWSWL